MHTKVEFFFCGNMKIRLPRTSSKHKKKKRKKKQERSSSSSDDEKWEEKTVDVPKPVCPGWF